MEVDLYLEIQELKRRIDIIGNMVYAICKNMNIEPEDVKESEENPKEKGRKIKEK